MMCSELSLITEFIGKMFGQSGQSIYSKLSISKRLSLQLTQSFCVSILTARHQPKIREAQEGKSNSIEN